MSDRTFIPGLALSGLLYETAVRPLLAQHAPDLVYSAALIGDGSDVLGFDTPQSTDHGWGPRLRLFLSPEAFDQRAAWLNELFQRELPAEISGYPIDMAWLGHPSPPAQPASGRLHRVEIETVDGFLLRQLGQTVTGPLTAVDWLLMPQQLLRSVTAGTVFHDGLNVLEPLRRRLGYYPHDVWLYVMAGQWRRVAQEEAFMGRCAQVGDESGSRIVAARLVRDLMLLAFLIERTYAPYVKWLGTGFSQLRSAATLDPELEAVLAAGGWTAREAAMLASWRTIATAHNALGVTEPLPVEPSPYYERPFQVIHGERFEMALLEAISDPAVRALPPYLGSVDQIVDTTDLLSAPGRLQPLRRLFEAAED